MKNTFLKTIGATTLAILMLAFSAQIWVSAQDNGNAAKSDEQPQEDLSAQNGIERALEGSWDTQLTIFNCRTGAVVATFPAMNTFMQGGTMEEFSAGSAPLPRGPGPGVWSYNSGQSFSYVYRFYRFNADGTYAGLTRSKWQVQLSQSANTYTGIAAVELLNPAGVVVGTACANGVGTRFEL